MAKVEHYRGLDTDLEKLYNSIRAEIENEKNLQILSEYKGEMNVKPLRSIVALNKSLKVFAGSLREIHISVLGTPDDYAVEVASGAWFGSILFSRRRRPYSWRTDRLSCGCDLWRNNGI
jgi:hypothetical protein